MYLTSPISDGTTTNWVMTTGSANMLANLGFGTGALNTVRSVIWSRSRTSRRGTVSPGFIVDRLADQREIQIPPQQRD